MYNVYVDDTMPHAHFRSKEQFCQFHRILDEQETLIQFTIEDENEEKCLNFIDIKTKNSNGRYELDFDCKTTLTKVQSKPRSCISSRAITCIFKRLFV